MKRRTGWMIALSAVVAVVVALVFTAPPAPAATGKTVKKSVKATVRKSVPTTKRAKAPKVTVDITSGLSGPQNGGDSSVAVQAAATVSPSTTVPPPFQVAPVQWASCGSFECATVAVPRDYDRPTLVPDVKLSVLRSRATGTDRIGTLFIYPGGPGGSSVSSVQNLARRLPSELTRRFDLVGVDSRGLARSTPLRCGNTTDLGPNAAARNRYATSCRANVLEAITTTDSETNARDLDSVRAAMNEPAITFLGYSYGGQLGRAYAVLFPERVRAMILDSPTDPGTAAAQRVVDQFEARESTLASFLQYCAARPACGFNDGSDLKIRYENLAAQIATQPLQGPGYVLDRQLFETVVDDQLRADSLWPALGLLLRDLATTRSLARVTALGPALSEGGDGASADNGLAVYLATICRDGFLPGSQAELDDLTLRIPLVAPHFVTRLDVLTAGGACAQWPVPGRPVRVPASPPLGPTLIITSVWDLTTPHEWGQQLAQSIGAAILPVDRTGHGIFPGLSCVDAIATRFLVDLTPPVVGTRCA